MQRGKKKELPKRSRYYSGSIDLDLIASGEPYTKLKKTYVIFICTFDPFSAERHIYTFENRCTQDLGLVLGDETTKIFLNTQGKLDDVDNDMKEFLAYVENSTDTFVEHSTSQLVREIHKKVIEVKQNKEMEVEYMTLLQRDRENLEQGREEGREEGARLAAKIIKLYSKGEHAESIATSLHLDLEYVGSIIADYENV